MPEQRKRVHCVAEIALLTTFLLASEVPAIAAFARSGLHTKPQLQNVCARVSCVTDADRLALCEVESFGDGLVGDLAGVHV